MGKRFRRLFRKGKAHGFRPSAIGEEACCDGRLLWLLLLHGPLACVRVLAFRASLRCRCQLADVIAAALAGFHVAFGDKLLVGGFDGDEADSQVLCRGAFRGKLLVRRDDAAGYIVPDASIQILIKAG